MLWRIYIYIYRCDEADHGNVVDIDGGERQCLRRRCMSGGQQGDWLGWLCNRGCNSSNEHNRDDFRSTSWTVGFACNCKRRGEQSAQWAVLEAVDKAVR